MQNLDWMLVAVVAASFLCHFGFVIYLRNIDWPRKPDIEEIPDRFVQMIVPKKVEEQKPSGGANDKDKKEEKTRAEEGQGRGEARRSKAPRDPEAEARAAAERRARLAADDAARWACSRSSAPRARTARSPISSRAATSRATPTRCSRRSAASASPGRRRGRIALGQGRGRHRLVARRRLACAPSGPGEVGTGERGGEHAVKAHRQGLGADRRRRLARPERHRQGDPQPHSAPSRRATRRASSATRTSAASWQLRFEVSSVGKVTSAEIENDTMHDEEVASCIKAPRHDLALPGARRRLGRSSATRSSSKPRSSCNLHNCLAYP